MKRFNEWLSGFRGEAGKYSAVGRLIDRLLIRDEYRATAMRKPTEDDILATYPNGIDKEDWVRHVAKLWDDTKRPRMWVLSGLARDGVKVFRPTLEESYAMAQTDLNVTWESYQQPFETFVILNPVEVEPDGVFAAGRPGMASAYVVRYKPGELGPVMLALGVYGTYCMMDLGGCWGGADKNQLIENSLRCGVNSVGLGLPDDDAWRESFQYMARVTINSCLMLTQFGAVRKGYLNPVHAAKLEASLKKKKLPDSIREANRTALRLIPDVYAFDQSVTLFDREVGAGDGSAGGCEVKPHWRRGHWAKQAHGVGGSLRKLVFRRPTLVNAHKFHGDRFDTTVTYTTPEVRPC